MTNRQIQPVRNRDIQIIRQARPRSLWGQVWTVALQPNNFFQVLPQTPSSSRQWFWVAVLILALNGFSAVRQDALVNGTGDGSITPPVSQSSGGDFSGGGGFPTGPAGSAGFDTSSNVPSDSGTGTSDISSTWVTALISGTSILVGWFVLALILCEVPLFNGVRPSFGQNLQIAIWTTVPLGIMAGLQVIYLAAGGKVGAGGISGLLDVWKGYNDLSPLLRSILLSLTSRLTVFWVWTLILIYIGGRQALEGKPWAVGLVVVIWVLILVIFPVLTGSIGAPTVTNNEIPQPITLPESGDFSTDGSGTLNPDLGSSNGADNPNFDGNSSGSASGDNPVVATDIPRKG